jgi:hypothetical protein
VITGQILLLLDSVVQWLSGVIGNSFGLTNGSKAAEGVAAVVAYSASLDRFLPISDGVIPILFLWVGFASWHIAWNVGVSLVDWLKPPV